MVGYSHTRASYPLYPPATRSLLSVLCHCYSVSAKKRNRRESGDYRVAISESTHLEEGLKESLEDARAISDRHLTLEQFFVSRNLTTVDVKGDGNCFYRAACFGLHGSDICHDDLRQHVADYVVQSGSLLRGLITTSSNKALFAMYVQLLKTDKEPVGEEAIIALTNMCQREVHVCTAHVKPLTFKSTALSRVSLCCLPSSSPVTTGLSVQRRLQVRKLDSSRAPFANINCIHFNACSLYNKIGELYSLLDGFLFDINFDLILVCETRLNSNDTDGLLVYNNCEFTVVRHDRSGNARGGGVCIFICNTLNFSVVSLPAAYGHLEVVCVV